MNLSCIVCAIDSADTSPAVLASAMALAAWDNAELRVVYLADDASDEGFQAPSVVAPHHEVTVVRGGDPVAAVVAHARRVRADLIVAGATLAARGIDRLGRPAEVIARDAHCPVLIVPLAAPHRHEELPYRNILCPVDFSPGSVLACERALTLTQDAGGTLTLLHVVDEFRDRQGDIRFLRDDERLLRMGEARARLQMAIAEASLPWSHVGAHVTAGAADVHIVAEARRLNADLIVMGLTTRMDEAPARMGTMVGRVAAQAACPVLVLRVSAGDPGWDDVYDASDHTALHASDRVSGHASDDDSEGASLNVISAPA